MYCAMTDVHCMLCLRNDTRPRPRGKKYEWGRGGGGGEGASIGLPPKQLHSHHATAKSIEHNNHSQIIYRNDDIARLLKVVATQLQNAGRRLVD